jgi:gentisate 1,2-dioxygenase
MGGCDTQTLAEHDAHRVCCAETAHPRRRSASAVLHVVDGEIDAEIDTVALSASTSDTLTVPTHAKVTHLFDHVADLPVDDFDILSKIR